jgi:translation initiation factor 5
MANVNIRRVRHSHPHSPEGLLTVLKDVSDPYYRYKMERLQSKIEGKGNGIKTVVANLSSVAHSLSRPPSYVIKYFGFELGAQTNINPSDDRWIINGAHEASKLQDHLDGFITRFVLCKNCKNPETDVVIKDGNILLDCKACGHPSNVDLRLKLSGFILKNQPKKGKKDKATKKARRAQAKENGGKDENASLNGGSPGESQSDNGDENGDLEQEANSDDELTRRINAEAKGIDQPNGDVNEDEWNVDMSPEAIAARQNSLPEDFKRSLVLDDGDEDGEEGGASNAYDLLGTWIIETAKTKGDVAKVEDIEIYKKAKELGIESKHKTLIVLAQSIFSHDIVKQIPERAGMLKKMITSERHQKAFLGGTERFVGVEHPDKLIAQVPAILMGFYQEDLITEEVLTAWCGKAGKKYVDIGTSRKVRQAAKPFLEWLQNAESDEDSDDE